jgi:protein TonB
LKYDAFPKAVIAIFFAMVPTAIVFADEPPLITRLNIPSGMTPPRAIPGHAPSVNAFYPASAIHCEESGATKLEITIAADGSVIGAKMLASSGYADLDDAARKAALTWIYAPATQNGKPVAIRILATAMFLNRNPPAADCPPPHAAVAP